MSDYYRLNADGTTEPTDELVGAYAVDRRVDKTTIGDYEVSTVFLSINHAWGGGPPLLFETMVFAEETGYEDLFCARYATIDRARAGHARVVAALTAGVDPSDLDLSAEEDRPEAISPFATGTSDRSER